jgi:hypothetical protein
MGHQHSCMYGSTSQCRRNVAGKPKSKKCPGCGGHWLIQEGMFGVFTWRGDGRYRLEDAHATYSSEKLAYRRITTGLNPTWVVRFISA